MSGPRPFSRVELQDLLFGPAEALPDEAREAMFTRTFTAGPDPALDELVPPPGILDEPDAGSVVAAGTADADPDGGADPLDPADADDGGLTAGADSDLADDGDDHADHDGDDADHDADHHGHDQDADPEHGGTSLWEW